MRTAIPLLMAAHTTSARAYHIGTPGAKWGPAEVAQWRGERVKSRSYAEDVVAALEPLRENFDVVEYGRLSYEGGIDHPLFAVKTKGWRAGGPCAQTTWVCCRTCDPCLGGACGRGRCHSI